MGEDATTIVTEVVIAGANDVAVTGVTVWTYDGVVGDPGTGTIGVLLCGVTPCTFAGVTDETITGVFVGLNAGVFVKMPDGWLDEDDCWIGSINDNGEWAAGVAEIN